MATSGSLTTSGYQNRTLTFSWSESSQSVENNTTTISWNLKGSGSASGYYLTQNITVKIDGKVVYEHLKDKNGQIQLYNGTTVTSGTYTFTHASDGKKSFTVYVEAGIYVWAPNCSGTKSFTLDDIPRQATITSAPNFNDEGNPVVKYNNPAGSAVSALDIAIYDSAGSTSYAAYRAASKTGTEYTFNLTTAERNALRNATPNSNTMTVKFYLRTKIGDNTFYSSVSKTLTITNPNPTLSPTVEDTGSVSLSLTGDKTKIIKGYNSVKVTFGAAAVKGATLKSKKVTNGSLSLTADGTLQNVDSGTFKFTATDSRGNTTNVTKTMTMINYVKLTANLKRAVVSTSGVLQFNIEGNYFNGSFGAVSNTLTVQYRYKVDGGSYGSWVALSPTKSGNTYSASGSVSGLDYKKTYVLQIRAMDKIYNGDTESAVSPSAKKVKSTPVFDWGEEDFNFNVPVTDKNGDTMRGIITQKKEITTNASGNYSTGLSANEYILIGASAWDAVYSRNTCIYINTSGVYGVRVYPYDDFTAAVGNTTFTLTLAYIKL